MQAPAAISRDLVLVGGGHSHALVLRMLAMRPISGLRITLVSPASHTPYSGMLPGLVAGHYSFEQAHIDLARLCQWAGVRFIAAEVTALDPQARRLSLAGRPAIEYDLVSIDVGSQPELDTVPGAREHAVPVKPVASLWQRWQQLVQRLDEQPPAGKHRIAVVGGGAGSVELALAMAHSLADRSVEIGLWCGAGSILQGYNAGARGAVTAALAHHGVALTLDARVERVEAHRLLLAGGEAHFDELFWCTGAAAAPWVAASGLPVDAQGFLEITDSLQSMADARVFGAGDIATQVNHPRPKAGVYAVRQGPVLAHNLRAALLGKPLRDHRPQQRFLSLVSLGDRIATADRGPFNATGKWVWRWKDWIDRKFMARFEQLPTSMPRGNWGSVAETAAAPGQHPCGGCGAKIGADPLARVLAELAQEFPRYSPAAGTADDTAAIPGSGAATIVQSLDILRELVADPWLMGRIAANHALSDLYASGARPLSALAAVTLPFAAPDILERELKQLLAGALHEFAKADCQLAGGHSMQGPELSIGFAVNGIAMAGDGHLLAKRGLASGDKLLLTRPLGTGVLFAAHMQLAADGRQVSSAIDNMLASNGPAAELALAHGATACTDITGFGLLGHLLEMLGEHAAANLQLANLPLLDGALELLRRGVRSSMHPTNAAVRSELQVDTAVDEGLLEILFDPQTSGGLLIAVPGEQALTLLDALRASSYSQAEIIGEVIARDSVLAPVHIS